MEFQERRLAGLCRRMQLVFVALALICHPGWASTSGSDPPAGEEAPSLMDLSWIAGHWSGSEEDVSSEEWWTNPLGGMMLGVHRDISPNGRTFFEYLRIVEANSGLVYIAQPLGRPPTEFSLKEVGKEHVVFENAAHDFPQRIIYRVSRQGSLVVRIEGEVDGEERSSEWQWRRTQ